MLWDSNIIIYAGLPEHVALRHMAQNRIPVVSAISRIEVLGYHGLSAGNRLDYEAFFMQAQILPVTEAVIDEAVRLRQFRKMKLGDSIVAATALLFGHTLVTRNARDFKDIDGLVVLDPFVTG